MHRLLLPLLTASLLTGCPPTSDDDDDSAGGGPEEPATDALTATCGPELAESPEDTLTSEPLDASFLCDAAGCTLSLPDGIPTRSYAALRVADAAVALFGWEPDEILWGHAGGVERIIAPGWSFAVTDEDLWVVSEQAILQVRPGGAIHRRCPLPADLGDDFAVVDVEDGTLFLSGYSETDERTVLYRATVDGWEPLPTGVWPSRVVHHRDDDLFVLAYGYYEVLSLDTLETQQLGGSDDDFSGVTVCADGSYWVGGQTGLNLYCTASHACGERLDGYPFQSASYRCNEDGDLEWLLTDQDVVTLHTLTPGNVQTEEPAPDGLRHMAGRDGRTWWVVDAE